MVLLLASLGLPVVMLELAAGYLYDRRNAVTSEGYEDALILALEKNYEVLVAAGRRHHVPFVIPVQDRFQGEWVQNNCHLPPKGEEVKAQIMFEELNPLCSLFTPGKPSKASHSLTGVSPSE